VSRAKKLVCAEIVNFVHPYTGDTPLHLAVVCPDGKRKQLMELLTRKGALLNEKNKAFLTPLHLAAELLHYDAMEVLLKQSAKVNALDSLGQTPLHRCARDEQAVRLLLSYESDFRHRQYKSCQKYVYKLRSLIAHVNNYGCQFCLFIIMRLLLHMIFV